MLHVFVLRLMCKFIHQAYLKINMEIPQMSNFRKLLGIFLVSCAALNSSAFADQLSIVYADRLGDLQTLTISTDSSHADLVIAASLLGEFGVSISVVSGVGTDSIADIAGAMAAASPGDGPKIAQVLAVLVPDEADAIVQSVSNQPGVNSNSVASAVQGVVGDARGGTSLSITPPQNEGIVSGN